MLAQQRYWPLAATDQLDGCAPAVTNPEPKLAPASHRFATALIVAVVAHVAAVLVLVAIPLRYSAERPATLATTVQFPFGGLAETGESPAATGVPLPGPSVPAVALQTPERIALPGESAVPASPTVVPLEVIGVSVVDAAARIAATGIADTLNVSVGSPTGTGTSAIAGAPGATGAIGNGGADTGGISTGTRAAYLHSPRPRYPSVARHNGWEGLTILRVEVEATGKAVTVEVLQSSGHDVLDQAAIAAVRDWKFAPARAGNKPIVSWLEVPIRFRLIDA